MIRTTILLASSLLCVIGVAQVALSMNHAPIPPADTTELYDATLAKKLGADDFGMRTYVLAVLRSGPNQDIAPEQVSELQAGHMAHIRQLAEDGVLVLAGPFVEEGDRRGLFLFNVTSKEEARQLADSDPAVAAGRFEVDLYTWYGSAALPLLTEYHARIARVQP